MFADALKGEGIPQQSAEMMATAIARRLVGRRVEIDRNPPISATVERIDEVTPATGLAAISTSRGEVPMWQRVRGRIIHASVGERTLEAVDLTVTSVRMVGAASQRLRVGRVEFDATVAVAEMERWATEFDGNHVVRVHEGRIEATDRRIARWAWVEVTVAAAEQTIVVTPVALRILGRDVPLLSRLRRPVERPVPWLPAELVVDEVHVIDEAIGVRGGLDDVLVPVDVSRFLTEVGSEGTRSVLKIVTGDW
jgi:hypothetical protein